MTNTKTIFAGLFTATLVSACATTPIAPVGDSNRTAIDQANSKQVVSTTALTGAPTLHPEMSAAAIERYLEDNVKQPESGGSFSPNGGGGGGGSQ